MFPKVATAIALAAALAGCAVPYSPAPLATNFPTVRQEKLQAAGHWNAIGDDVEQRIVKAMKKHPQRPFFIAEDKDASPFKRAVTAQIVTSLIKDGFVVSRTPAGAWKLELDIQAVTFAPDRQSGAFTAIANGAWVLAETSPTVGVTGLAGATPQTELIVTLSVGDQFRYYARSTSAYYVADSDRALYGMRSGDLQLTKAFPVQGGR